MSRTAIQILAGAGGAALLGLVLAPMLLDGPSAAGGVLLAAVRTSVLAALGGALLALTLGLLAGLAGGSAWPRLGRGVPSLPIADRVLGASSPLLVLLVAVPLRVLLGGPDSGAAAALVVVLSVGLARWPDFARPVREAIASERDRPYVDAARLLGLAPDQIAWRHVLPNALRSVPALFLRGVAVAACDEALLSFLGAGFPPGSPSLATLLRAGLAGGAGGAWWGLALPALALALPLLALHGLTALGLPRPAAPERRL